MNDSLLNRDRWESPLRIRTTTERLSASDGGKEVVRFVALDDVCEWLRRDDTDMALDLELWAESDLAHGQHSLSIDAHVAAAAIRKKIAEFLPLAEAR